MKRTYSLALVHCNDDTIIRRHSKKILASPGIDSCCRSRGLGFHMGGLFAVMRYLLSAVPSRSGIAACRWLSGTAKTLLRSYVRDEQIYVFSERPSARRTHPTGDTSNVQLRLSSYSLQPYIIRRILDLARARCVSYVANPGMTDRYVLYAKIKV